MSANLNGPTTTDDVSRAVQTALSTHPGLGFLSEVIQLTIDETRVRLSGELPSLEVKRRAHVIASKALPDGMALSDRLVVRPLVHMEDDEILDTVARELTADVALQECTITHAPASGTAWRSQPRGPARGRVSFSIAQGVIRLEGVVPDHLCLRVAEALAWRCLGGRAVDNHLSVLDPRHEGDDGLAEALGYVLQTEPLLFACDIDVSVRQGVATLTGTAIDAPAREIAELNTWFVPGVEDVHNQLDLRAG